MPLSWIMHTYKCYYCTDKFDAISDIVTHCQDEHGQNVLKYRQLMLDENSGKQYYQTKIHEGIIPFHIELSGKSICIQNSLVYVCDNISKRKRLNTPIKENCRKHLEFGGSFSGNDTSLGCSNFDETLVSSIKKLTCSDINTNELGSDEEQDENTDLLKDLYSMLPTVLKNLSEVGQKDSFMNFVDLIYSGEFPFENICYLLFMDLADWQSCDTTSRMRYRPETVKFWQIGFKLK